MKIHGAIPEGYVKAMEKKDAKGLNPMAYESNDKKKYSKLSPDDQLTISFLNDELDKSYSKLKDIVTDMLRRQGVQVGNLKHLNDDDLKGIKIDKKAQSEAAQMIGPDGPMNAENTADRIFQFAKAISGGDTEKYDKLKEAIKAGFDAAKDALGGELPEISQKTYDLVMEKLDDWAGVERPEKPVEEVASKEPVEESKGIAVELPVQEESIVTKMLDAEEEVEE